MKTLGLDIGTNSIGWGIVDETANKIEGCGVYIFPEGVKKEKGNESSKAAERTNFRLARRLKFRRKLRKCETLKVLIKNKMCPLTMEELEKWRKQKVYPVSQDFLNWYRTDELKNWEPYFLRKKCAEQKAGPYEIGRAVYHLAQRRGFLSNRKESTKASDGKVSKSIDELSSLMDGRTLGQYFYELKQSGEKVRGKYTSRKEHYEKEFNKICEVQEILPELKDDLYRAIFFQRKLKSQKFLVGKCTFERNKPRAPISHFEFEEFRMLSFINSIKIAKNSGEDENCGFEFLTEEEKELIKPLFFRISKPSFQFADIEKKLKGKNGFWKFNYRKDTNVSGCPVSAGLKNIFGDEASAESWKDKKVGQYDMCDIWHVLFDFDDEEKLLEFAKRKLFLSDEAAKKFCAIRIQQGYANLSLKAIRKITPFLRKGYIYSTAVFLANIPFMIGRDIFLQNEKEIEDSVKNIIGTLRDKNNIIVLANRCIESAFKDKDNDFRFEEWDKALVENSAWDLFGKKKWNEYDEEKRKTIISQVSEKVEDNLKIAVGKNPNDYKYPLLRTGDLIMDYLNQKGFVVKGELYHPSDTDYNFETPVPAEDGKIYLASPRSPSVKNPVVMRALHQLRKLVNYLIKTGKIDSTTKINVELANDVNDKNQRKAIEELAKTNEKNNADARKKIEELCNEAGFKVVPTESDIKKFRLWKEQNETCPYTGKHISFTDLFGPIPKFDFEHTIPRSLSYDDSLENLTLCDSEFNRNIKKQRLPSELPDFEEINKRFLKFYEDKIDNCLRIIELNSKSGGSYEEPAVKDLRIVKKHKAQYELNYYKEKLRRFSSTEITSGFKHSQLNDTRIITKFSLSYLKGVFDHVQPVKGSMTDTFKRQWGLMERNEIKDRSNHTHHTVDALTIACINRGKFNLLSEAIKNSSDGKHLKFPKPWETFDTDVLNAVRYIIPKYFSDENSLRQSKKILRGRDGKPVLKDGKTVFIQGATARGSLHKDTFYGCIKTVPEEGGKSEMIFVQRIPVATLDEKVAEKIIDKRIRETFENNLSNGIQTLQEIQTDGILLPFKKEGRDVFVKRVRIKAKPTSPIILKKHHNVINKNPKDYKQNYYVVNDENYLLAIYRGKDAKGKDVSDHKICNLLDAVKSRQNRTELYPDFKEKKGINLQLYKVLKVGKIVILQDDIQEDVFALPKEKLWKRMYRIAGLAASGNDIQIKLVHIISARPWEYMKGERDLNAGIECLLYGTANFKGLLEGQDFTVSPAGEIIQKARVC
ncbi:type II CRISPR RNA-guided endonuclease Cas9 [Treponema vincentii]|uniref:type II CRISPR RNA-guided endonuclease Cas9 n=1 Tax=Treponema vincentii TaxID=69710 RepID=UPI003D8F4A72